ncbi:PREDICTED: O-acetyl-ADP-ribose deacetylase MACROD1 [Nanorana parkeri]|uniref:O-acetyl-ADP-ribose deacetylase MACROD1 n=1 Tax=Nanorana parkeri TaxID=125878 RepID=UPI0008550388|nr:PREDICTED: O-acetyl-ADP-ribose deacetylase MACROD1 [Nanorana parkeri]
MICRVITERWLIGRRCLSASTCTELPAAVVSTPLPVGRRASLIYPAARPCGFPVRRAPPVFCPVPLLHPPILPTRRLCNLASRKGESLSPHRDIQPAFPYWSISRPLTLSAYIMAASGKIDLNSPSTTWKEAKNILKGLNKKQRREQYGAKDFIKLKDIPTWKDTAKKIKAKQPEEVKFPKNKDLIEKISFFRGDITKLEVDAIVNAAKNTLLGGGGVDGCIHQAAGPLLKHECSSLGGCETGQSKITCGYLLPARYVIHTVGPVAEGNPGPTQKEDLSNCYKNSMHLASENKLRSVAFPCISTGVFGYPSEEAADVALENIRSYLEDHKDKFDRIIICVFLEKDEEIYLKKLPEYFPFDQEVESCKL